MAVPTHQRLKLAKFEFEKRPSGHCRARVDFEGPNGDVYTGEAQGKGTPTVELRCAAEAAMAALKKAIEGQHSVAFLDAWRMGWSS